MLKISTLACVVLLVVVAEVAFRAEPDPAARLRTALILFGALGAGALFTIRGYRLEGDVLLVRRLGWNSRIDLAGLQSAEADPAAMNGSIRTFGNGGFFCFAGAYWNRRLRSYRAFVTYPRRAVVLRFPRRTVVVTPEHPEEFVAKLKAARGLA